MEKSTRRAIGSGLAAFALLGALALQGAPRETRAATAHSSDPNTLIVDYQSDLSHLDSALCYDTSCYPYTHAMYDQLIGYDTSHGNGDTLVPDAAAAMPTVTNGGKTYIFKLRHDVRFWNGRLATSADWVYSFNRIINPKTQSGAQAFWLDIVGAQAYVSGKAPTTSGIKALGQWGLEIDLDSPYTGFLNVLAMPFGSVVDKNQIAKYGKTYDALHPMGTGPYMFQSRIPGVKLVLVKNPNYFGHNKAHINTIEADFGVSTETSYLRIVKGDADLDGDFPTPIPPSEFLNVLNDPVLSKRVVKQVQVADQYIAMNTQLKPFNNLLVRQAVEYAVNKPALLRLVNGRGSVTNNFIPPNMAGYGAFNLYPYNPAKAKQLLAQAGYPHGFSTTFYTDNLGDDPRLSQGIVQQLSQIGIQASLRVLAEATWQGIVMSRGKAPISWTAWYQDFPDPNDFFEPILSCASAIPGTFNLPFYCNPKVDAYAAKLKHMTDQQARMAGYPALDKMVMQDAPVDPIFNSVYYALPSANLHNFYLHNVWTLIFADYTKS
ncbi:MAG TPA: ABC transporter substrate-binding protein [Chloroflexota bacterium]|nr:ABC transporter substrate-binding protein [Chloroflexota bacterium]